MANAVDGASRSYAGGVFKSNQRPQAQSDTPQANHQDNEAKLNLNAAGAVQQLSKQLAHEAPVDRQRIEQIKQAISSGEYHVDPERVGSKFTELEQLLGKV